MIMMTMTTTAMTTTLSAAIGLGAAATLLGLLASVPLVVAIGGLVAFGSMLLALVSFFTHVETGH